MNSTKTLAVAGGAGLAALIAVATAAQAHIQRYSELQAIKTDIAAAIAIAQAAVPGTVMEAELERENGQLIWQITVRGEDMTRTRLDLDANSGEILEQKSKQKKRKHEGGRDRIEVIGIEQALEIASAESDGLVVEAELERKRGRVIWEIELVGEDNSKTEVRLDGATGEAL